MALLAYTSGIESDNEIKKKKEKIGIFAIWLVISLLAEDYSVFLNGIKQHAIFPPSLLAPRTRVNGIYGREKYDFFAVEKYIQFFEFPFGDRHSYRTKLDNFSR